MHAIPTATAEIADLAAGFGTLHRVCLTGQHVLLTVLEESCDALPALFTNFRVSGHTHEQQLARQAVCKSCGYEQKLPA